MGIRGRTSAADLAVVAGSGAKALPRRPDAPAELSDAEVRTWREIVASLAVDWFTTGDLPVLAEYCRAVSLANRAAEACEDAPLTVTGAQGGEIVNPVFRVQDMAAKRVASLAVKLRLAQSSRYGARAAATKHGAPAKKAWELR